MTRSIRILWCPNPGDGQREPQGIEYRFSSAAELFAFELGIAESSGWGDHVELDDNDGDLQVCIVTPTSIERFDADISKGPVSGTYILP